MANQVIPYQKVPPARGPEATARLAWTILGAALLCFLVLCGLVGYGLWRLRASAVGPQQGSTIEAFASPVYRIYAGKVEAIEVPLHRAVPLQEGETVRVGQSAPPGTDALVTLWEGSTLQLYAGTRVSLVRLQATSYSDQFQDVVLELEAGQTLLGVAQVGRYQRVQFDVLLPGARVELDPGGTYLLRADPRPEVAVRRGQARLQTTAAGTSTLIAAGQKVTVWPGRPLEVEPARWQLLENGDFSQEDQGWSFRSDQYGDGGDVNAVYRRIQEMVGDQVVWAIELERMGGLEDLCAAILSQEVKEDLSPYRSVRLDFDLNLRDQGLKGGGPRGEDYPFAVRIRYQDAEGRSRQYLYGFYFVTGAGAKTTPDNGEARKFPHYRWEHVSLDLLALQPRPVLLNGVDLMASGQDYRSWVANVSLTAALTDD